MTHIIQILPMSSVVQFFDTQLEAYQVRIWQSWNRSLGRWMLDIENQTLGMKSYGIVMNQGTDMLNQSGRLDLQALVLTNMSRIVGLEAEADTLGDALQLVYMDLDTYNEFILQGAIVGRDVYRVGV